MSDPLTEEMTRRYRLAREAYRQPGIAEACAVIGMSEREYSDRYVGQLEPVTFTMSTGSPGRMSCDPDSCFAAGKP